MRKQNWTKEEECTLIDEIESAGETLRGPGNSADIIKRKRQLWKDITARVNSIYGNNRTVDDIRKKWNNVKLAAKSKVDASFREARKTGGGSNTSGMIADEDVLIVAADKRMTTSDRIRDMFESTPAFGGISGAVDNFVVPHENTEPSSQGDYAVDVPIQDAPEVEVPTLHQVSKKSRKRKRLSGTELHDCPSGSERRVEMRTSDLLPLQQEVLLQQMKVFSAQLALIEEQREYYRLKRQRLQDS